MKDSIMESFGPRIKKLRQERGYTSQKVADEVGVSKGCVSFWGKRAERAESVAYCSAVKVFRSKLRFSAWQNRE